MIDLQAIEKRWPTPLYIDIPALIAEVRRYRELAKVVREIAKCESWHMLDAPCQRPMVGQALFKSRVADLLKEVHDG